MATYNVTPTRRGENGKWKVEKNGRKISTGHRKQSAAESTARQKANSGDTLVIHGRNGRIRDRKQVR